MMSKKYKEQINKLKHIQFGLFLVCIIILIGYIYFITRPKLTKYTLTDECGPIGGAVLHSISDIDYCDNICYSHCLSMEKGYYKTDFEKRDSPECNLCNCYCKD